MYFGELAEHSDDYINGHETGVIRAMDTLITQFALMERDFPKKKLTPTEILEIIKTQKAFYSHYCETYGMGIQPNEEKDQADF